METDPHILYKFVVHLSILSNNFLAIACILDTVFLQREAHRASLAQYEPKNTMLLI